ncbi:hypothetical protein [Helicobacter canis]|uniref:hypothetical protein n=1 Tax=Helicobacter canis TaxID=29419 RepID=UPI000E0F20E3|nr:hypothetical protein [Helicobacter canis]
MDSALRDKSLIASRVLQLHTPSMRPCTRLQSKDFSSQILESTFLLFRAVLSKVDSGFGRFFVICASLLLWDSRIFELKTAFFKPRKEIRLEVYRRSAAMKSLFLAKKLNP